MKGKINVDKKNHKRREIDNYQEQTKENPSFNSFFSNKSIELSKKVKSHSEPRRNLFNDHNFKRRFTTENMVNVHRSNTKNRDYCHPQISQNYKSDKNLKVFNDSMKNIESTNQQ